MMSLVAYGTSDESGDDDEVTPALNRTQTAVTTTAQSLDKNGMRTHITHDLIPMSLPLAKYEEISEKLKDHHSIRNEKDNTSRIQFNALPKPISYNSKNVVEADDFSLFKHVTAEKSAKPGRAPVQILVPSLFEFKDVDEELEKSKNRRTASKKGTGLFAILPPPKAETQSKKSIFVPHVLSKTLPGSVPKKPLGTRKLFSKYVEKAITEKVDATKMENPSTILEEDSNSEDDDKEGDNRDFYSSMTPEPAPKSHIASSSNFFSIPDKVQEKDFEWQKTVVANIGINGDSSKSVSKMERLENCAKTLISTVIDLPRSEVLLKNKPEIGPKLPIPEQEFNLDSEGNVAFDDKAIEYLCGKRGMKRKNQMIQPCDIIEINGEDMKSDEREWMVKALTEEPVQRPVSMQSAGPSSQSKKKHQITYLAHQAKAMEVELKNTWSQNRMTRKQTQSKYGF